MKHPGTSLCLCSLLSVVSAAPSHAILIDGVSADGRDWRQQTAALKAIFETGGLFQVDVVTASSTAQPAFEKFKLVVLNYGGKDLSTTTLSALEKFLNNGGGLVALPGSESGFQDSAEYKLMLGILPGANPGASPLTDKDAGPLWFYKDGNVAYDNTALPMPKSVIPPGKPFLVTIRNTEHPVTKGLPLEWLHAPDELVGNLRGPGKDMAMLATALSDASAGGTGRNEPQILAIKYGKGRVFHSVLGRTQEALQCAGLQTMLQRGAEWAATGKVIQRIPADFPDSEKVSRRPK